MSWFALAASWTGRTSPAAQVRAMGSALAHLAPDGTDEAALSGVAAALGRRAVTLADRALACDVDAAAKVLVVGDVRLFNRRELARALGLRDGEVSDLGLVRAGYQRWGRDVVSRLVGGFAFALWDGERRSVLAARDHLGLRPLHYRWTDDGVLVASDASQLVAATPERLPPRAEKVLDYLLGDFAQAGRSFLDGVELLAPGHCLVATAGGAAAQRYWFPPSGEVPARSERELAEAFLATFRQVVRDNLESAWPLVAHMSGGFDSTSILAVADEIYRAESGRPKLVTASALAPGLECDETPRIDVVARHVGFEGMRWSALATNHLDLTEPLLGAPGVRRGIAGGPPRDLEHAREIGARVLIAGSGGDEVGYARGIFRHLVAERAWRTLIRETLLAFPPRIGLHHLADGLRGVLSPELTDRLRDRWPGRPREAPATLGPSLRGLYPGAPDTRDEPAGYPWRDHLQRGLWRSLTSPSTSEFLHVHNLFALSGGVELRVPYLDVRLVELVLGAPPSLRLPHGGMRRLQREALRPLMPPENMAHNARVSFASAWAANTRRLLPQMAEIIETGDWLSEPFVERAAARRLLRSGAEGVGAESWAALDRLWAIASFEAWTRRLARYYSSREVP
jgi:asparagine synthase (glutamine-hydrolysing)